MTVCLRSYVCGQFRLSQISPHSVSLFTRSNDGYDNQRINCRCCSCHLKPHNRKNRRLLSDATPRFIISNDALSHSYVYKSLIAKPVHYLSTMPPYSISKRGFHVSIRWFTEKSSDQKPHDKTEDKLEIGGVKEIERMIEKQKKLTDNKKLSLWTRFANELKHYFHGFRLLILDVRVAIRLTWNVAKGVQLTRRERKQLVRTVSDIFRLVPFIIFVIIPFMEFFLPIYLKMFPFMLPSTFKQEAVEKRKTLQQLKGKLEMAKFLQDTLMETSVVGKMKNETQAKEFINFLRKVRESGRIPKEEDIMNYCSLFADDITLDTLTHEQLKALCRLLDINPIGPSTVLRLQLEMRVRALKADDYMIAREGGVEKMAVWELITACRERGMRALGLSEERLRLQLRQWLHLHIDRHIPITLLLFTRAMYLPDQLKPGEQLAEFILRMPQEMIDQTELSVAERASERIDPRKKIDVIRQEQEAIDRERKEKDKEKAVEKPEKAAEKEKEEEKAEAAPEAKEPPVAVPPDVAEVLMEAEAEKPDEAPVLTDAPEEELIDKAPVLEDPSVELVEAKQDVEKEGLTVEDLKEVETAIIADRSTALDEEELDDLRSDLDEYETDVRRAMAVVGDTDVETKSAKRLVTLVNKLVNDMNSMVGELYEEKESLLEDIEVAEVLMRRATTEDKAEMSESIASKKERVISINDLMLAIRKLDRLPDETRWQKILEVLDEDEDGQIELHHVIKVLDMLGTDNVKLTKDQMMRVLDTIDKEQLQERLLKDQKGKSVGKDEASTGDTPKETPPPPQEMEQKERG